MITSFDIGNTTAEIENAIAFSRFPPVDIENAIAETENSIRFSGIAIAEMENAIGIPYSPYTFGSELRLKE